MTHAHGTKNHESWQYNYKVFAREAIWDLNLVSGRWPETPKWTVFASTIYLKITLQKYCPEVSKVVPMGAKVDPQRYPEVIKMPPEIAVKRNIQK